MQKPPEAEVYCPEPGCGARMRLRWSPRFARWFYGCSRYPDCQSAHGAHPDGRPLGVPATEDVKRMRMAVHDVFDKLWRDERIPERFWKLARGEAYVWMASRVGVAEFHVGELLADGCDSALAALADVTAETVFGDLPTALSRWREKTPTGRRRQRRKQKRRRHRGSN